MPRPLDGSIRDNILDQAERLFLSQGYMETSMTDIATACSLSKPALYHHYRDKSEIYLSMVRRGISRIGQMAAQSLAGPEGLQERLVRLGELLAANPHADFTVSQQVLRQHFEPGVHAAVNQLFITDFVAPLTAYFAAEMAAGRMRRRAPGVMVFSYLSLVAMVRHMRRSGVAPGAGDMMVEAVSLLLPDPPEGSQ